jgi:hypothetical protein
MSILARIAVRETVGSIMSGDVIALALEARG